MFALEAHNLSIGYGKHVLARGLTLALRRGELTCLLGPNGVGKSTLIRTLCGMQPPLAGTIYLNGEDIRRMPARAVAQRLAVVLTQRVDAGNMSAYALAALGRFPHTNWLGDLSPGDEEIVQRAMWATDCAQMARRRANELSDGERQRVMIARALAQEPQVLVLDEPTAFLDIAHRIEIMHLTQRLAHEQSLAVLVSTHDLDLALRCADQLWLLNTMGSLTQGTPEQLKRSGDLACLFHSSGEEVSAYLAELLR